MSQAAWPRAKQSEWRAHAACSGWLLHRTCCCAPRAPQPQPRRCCLHTAGDLQTRDASRAGQVQEPPAGGCQRWASHTQRLLRAPRIALQPAHTCCASLQVPDHQLVPLCHLHLQHRFRVSRRRCCHCCRCRRCCCHYPPLCCRCRRCCRCCCCRCHCCCRTPSASAVAWPCMHAAPGTRA